MQYHKLKQIQFRSDDRAQLVALVAPSAEYVYKYPNISVKCHKLH